MEKKPLSTELIFLLTKLGISFKLDDVMSSSETQLKLILIYINSIEKVPTEKEIAFVKSFEDSGYTPLMNFHKAWTEVTPYRKKQKLKTKMICKDDEHELNMKDKEV